MTFVTEETSINLSDKADPLEYILFSMFFKCKCYKTVGILASAFLMQFIILCICVYFIHIHFDNIVFIIFTFIFLIPYVIFMIYLPAIFGKKMIIKELLHQGYKLYNIDEEDKPDYIKKYGLKESDFVN